MHEDRRSVCWRPTWSASHAGDGLEHLLLAPREADGLVVAIDDARGPFRLSYRLRWDDPWTLRRAELGLATADARASLVLESDGRGRWTDATGAHLPALDGCVDVDVWPTPFTNSFPILRAPLAVGERREHRVAWIDGLALAVTAQRQAYTRLADGAYRFESLDGGGFTAELTVGDDGLVLDYPGLFRRVA